MRSIYHYCQISRQAHFQALQSSQLRMDRIPLYESLILQTRLIHPGMSLRKIYQKTQPEGIGRDGFIALGLSLGYRLRAVLNKTRTTFAKKSNQYSNLLYQKRFTDVNQIWSSDITYFHFGDKFVYISLLMDVYSRRILGYSLAEDLRAIHSIQALKMALEARKISDYKNQLIHHSDRGSQYLSHKYTELLDQYQIQISTCESVYENTHIERVNQTVKNQYLYRWNIKNLNHLKKKIKDTIDAYNFDRPHDSLGGKTPAEFEAYIKEIPINDRPKLEIYTMVRNPKNQINPLQLTFNF